MGGRTWVLPLAKQQDRLTTPTLFEVLDNMAQNTHYIRTASERDLPTVQKLLGICWHATYDDIYSSERVSAITADWHSLSSLNDQLAKPYSEFIVAERSDGLAAMAYASQSDPAFVMLHQLYVLPGAQGQGLGREMLAEIEAAFPDAKAIRLEVEAANEKAVRFYERQGFETVSRTENCAREESGIAALIMQKSLR
jgi:ribosomal protein S18 acetylase RimI-like enzyme